jgi:TPR repeat protein
MQNHALAQYNLEQLYSSQASTPEQAFELFLASAQRGLPMAQNHVGMFGSAANRSL